MVKKLYILLISCGLLFTLTGCPATRYTSTLSYYSERSICYMAFNAKLKSWELDDIHRKYVTEAKSRGFDLQHCADVLGQTNTAVASDIYHAYTSKELCSFSIDTNTQNWKSSGFNKYIEALERRNLSLADCQKELGFKVEPEESLYSLCFVAISNGVSWDKSSEISRKYIIRAKSRGLSEEDCVQILGRSTTVALKPDLKPSYELIKRAQKALRSLGLYSGKIDGNAGPQSNVALSKWKKLENLPQNAEIDLPLVVKLELSVKNHLAKLEETRVKKEAEEKRIREAAARERKEKEEAEAARIAEIERKRKEAVALKIAAAKLKHEDAIAVIIGNRDYKGSTPDVDFAGNDADAMKKYVLRKLGYRIGNIIDLRDATQAELRDTFGTKESHKGRLYDYVRADESDVIVFYSGHGVPGMSDKRGYLLSVDSNPNRAEITGYPVDVLLKNLAKVPAKSMMVFIDACFSGDSPKGMLVRATSGLTVKITAPKKASDNMIVITAAQGDQFASWDEDAKHGLFTKHLLEALNGAADKHAKTGNKDGKVTLGEVKAYLDREMTYQARKRFSRDQHATVSGDLKTVLSAY